MLGNSRLNFDELYTVLKEIAATLNSCPLTYQYETDEVLTPLHLMFGYHLSPFSLGINPDADKCEADQTTLSKRFLFTDLREHHCL